MSNKDVLHDFERITPQRKRYAEGTDSSRKYNRRKTSAEEQEAIQIVKDFNSEQIRKYQENLHYILQEKKERIAKEVNEYLEKMPTVKTKDKKGNVFRAKAKHLSTPVILSILGKDFSHLYGEPKYSAIELAMVFDYYQQVIVEINMKGILFPATRQNFCIFAGISSSTYEAYLQSNDINKASIMRKIEDYIIESSWTEAMTGALNPYVVERRTKLKGIGGGYSEAKSDININVKSQEIGSPENMLDNLKDYLIKGDA